MADVDMAGDAEVDIEQFDMFILKELDIDNADPDENELLSIIFDPDPFNVKHVVFVEDVS